MPYEPVFYCDSTKRVRISQTYVSFYDLALPNNTIPDKYDLVILYDHRTKTVYDGILIDINKKLQRLYILVNWDGGYYV